MSSGRMEIYRTQPRDFSNLFQTCTTNIQKITHNRCLSTDMHPLQDVQSVQTAFFTCAQRATPPSALFLNPVQVPSVSQQGPQSHQRTYDPTNNPKQQPVVVHAAFQQGRAEIQYDRNTGQIKSMLFQLGSRPDTPELQDRLQQMQHYTNQLAKETNKHLKDLGSLPPPQSPSEQRQQRIQKDRLMNDFSAALNNFQVVQRRAAEREKESVARARASTRFLIDDGSQDETLVTFDKNEESRLTHSLVEEEPITEEDLELIKERETNIRQLEADIMDVNQIFKDLAVMIHDQGDLIDSIEANVESAEVHVEHGTEQLQRAAYYKKKSRKRMCILASVLSLVVIIFTIIIWQAIK